MQQQGQSGSASQPQYGVPQAPAASAAHLIFGAPTDQSQQHQVVEEASPISSRPPAAGNLEELMRISAGGGGGGGSRSGGGLMGDDDVLGEEADRGGGGGASRNRWPREETLALIQIRSEMDAAFRDATVKGPLWEDVSRKLAELGYRRSAKKCKEKFENVHKYYKRTKQGRAGRQDGKSYRFFSQLEALHNTSTSSSAIHVSSAASQQHPSSAGLDVAPVSVGIPMPMSSQPPPHSTTPVFPPGFTASNINPPAAPPPTSLGVSFSSDGSSSSSPSTEEDDGDDETEGQPSSTATGGSRKRKRDSHRGESRQMMEFFEGLMKQVMRKQEAMQQRFLEAMEKREQDRLIREEAWKRQEMAMLSREHEIMAQERAASASRDAAIVSFLQKITGQTIQLPSPMTVPSVPPQPQSQPQTPPGAQFPVPPTVPTTVSSQPQQSVQEVVQPPPAPKPTQQQQNKPQQLVQRHQQQPPASSEIIMAVPEQQVPPQQVEIGSMSSGVEAGSSSRWPKAEVLALINLRSGLETRYQEPGPKGPLWEEISAGMQRLGYNRSAKRCKEKWENINKYNKKVKESNKKRPEDSKTCPYFHQLDELYRKKILGGGGETSTATATTTGGGFAIQSLPESDQRQAENQQLDPAAPAGKAQDMQASESQNKNDTSVEGAITKPEDIVKELMEEQGQLMVDDISDHDESEEDEEDEEDDEDESELREERKMAYKIEFQRQNTNGRGNGAPPASFLAMVQ